MIAAVIATANHFVLAVIAGMALTILAYLLVPGFPFPGGRARIWDPAQPLESHAVHAYGSGVRRNSLTIRP